MSLFSRAWVRSVFVVAIAALTIVGSARAAVTLNADIDTDGNLTVGGDAEFDSTVAIGDTAGDARFDIFGTDGQTTPNLYVGPDAVSFSAESNFYLDYGINTIASLNTDLGLGYSTGFVALNQDSTAANTEIEGAVGAAIATHAVGTKSLVAGVFGAGELEGAGDVTTLAGVLGWTDNNGSGNVTNAAGFYTVGNSLDGTGVITNSYGIYLAPEYAGVNNWQLYSSGTEPSYFAGDVGIGVSAPAYKLQVNPTVDPIGWGLYDAQFAAFAENPAASGDGAILGRAGVAAAGGDNEARGIVGEAHMAGDFNYEWLVGGEFDAAAAPGAGFTVNTVDAVVTSADSVGDGTITDMTGVHVFGNFKSNPAGTIVNNYGIRIGDQTVGDNNWQLYSSGTAPSYFAGAVTIGAGTSLTKVIAASQADGVNGWDPDSLTSDFTITANAASIEADSVINVSLAANATPVSCGVYDTDAGASFKVKCSGNVDDGATLQYTITNF